MYLLAILFVAPFFISLVASYFIYSMVRKNLTKHVYKYTRLVSISSFIFSYLIILIALFVLISYNVNFDR